MIVTLTLNPAIDIGYYVNELVVGHTNRTSNYIKTAGGKGINVSKVLKQLGSDVTATGFIGGVNGQFITSELTKLSIIPEFVSVTGETRNCIAITDEDGNQTEILESGPEITPLESDEFLATFEELLQKENLQAVSASGSLPGGLSKGYYRKLIDLANASGVKFVLDTSGQSLKEGMKSSPYLIKPNIHELEDLMGKKLETEKDLAQAMENIQKQYGIRFLIVSLGGEGSIALVDGSFYRVFIPKVQVENPVGSGDSMVAGLVKGISENRSVEDILKLGNTCGILNAMSKITGHIKIESFQEIYDKIRIESVVFS